MDGDNECYKRPDGNGATRTSALSRFLDSTAFLIVMLVALGVLNYGWAIYPKLGIVWELLNGTIIIGIVVAGITIRCLSIKAFIKKVPIVGCITVRSYRLVRSVFTRTPELPPFKRLHLGNETDRSTRQILNLIQYAKLKNPIYAGQAFPAGYQTLELDTVDIKGQRNPRERIALVPVNFSGATVLDIGCNQGGMLLHLADRISTGIGIDYDSRLINVATRTAAHKGTKNLSFYTLDLDKDDISVTLDFLPQKRVDIALLLSICTWITNWKAVIDFVSIHSEMLLYESNGVENGQLEQPNYLETRYRIVDLLSGQSLDDPTHHGRRLYLCKEPYRYNVKRIAIIGVMGSGKTTLARKLGNSLNTEVIEVDEIYWLNNWRQRDVNEHRAILADKCKQESWIIDGNTALLDNVDLLIWLDMPFIYSFCRVCFRSVRYAIFKQPLWNGNRERIRGLLRRGNPIIRSILNYRFYRSKYKNYWDSFSGYKIKLRDSRLAYEDSMGAILKRT